MSDKKNSLSVGASGGGADGGTSEGEASRSTTPTNIGRKLKHKTSLRRTGSNAAMIGADGAASPLTARKASGLSLDPKGSPTAARKHSNRGLGAAGAAPAARKVSVVTMAEISAMDHHAPKPGAGAGGGGSSEYQQQNRKKALKRISKQREKLQRKQSALENEALVTEKPPGSAKAGGSGSHQHTFSKSEIEEMREVFFIVDTDSSGSIDASELRAAMKALGLNCKRAEVQKMISEADSSSNGEIEFPEFLTLIAKKQEEISAVDDVNRGFALFDQSGTGNITRSDLRWVADEVGETFTDQELDDMIREADLNGDGKVSRMEFEEILKRTHLYG